MSPTLCLDPRHFLSSYISTEKIFCGPQSASNFPAALSLFVSLSSDRTYFIPTSTFLSGLQTVCLYWDDLAQSMNDFNRNRKYRLDNNVTHGWIFFKKFGDFMRTFSSEFKFQNLLTKYFQQIFKKTVRLRVPLPHFTFPNK